jgi:hypothetical protein
MHVFQWTDGLIDHLDEHDISRDEFEEAFDNVIVREPSASTGRPTIVALVRGRFLRVVFETLPNGDILPVTAFEIRDWQS